MEGQQANKVEEVLRDLTHSIGEFKKRYIRNSYSAKTAGSWSGKDILAHLTYWHELYVRNLLAEEEKKKFVFPNTRASELNKEGVSEYKHFPDEELLKRFVNAQTIIERVITGGMITEMTYSKGEKPYPILKFLEVVSKHVKGHISELED